MKKKPSCAFCTDEATYLVPKLMEAPNRPVRCCPTCGDLVISGEWFALANRWLSYRPEAWSDDVTSYLEAWASGVPLTA